MKTKTVMFGVIATLAIVIFASSLIMAEESSSTVQTDTAVSEVGTGQIFWKEVGLLFTFNQERKIEKEMQLAQLRLQQAEYATEHNDTKGAEKALEAYKKLVERADKRNQLIQSKETANVNAVKLAAMDQAILVHQEKIKKLSDLLANASLTEEERAKLESRLSQAQNVTSHLEEVQTEKEDRLKTRIMAQENLTEEQAEEILDEAKDNANEIVDGAKEAWKNFKDEAKANNMTPNELAKQRRQEFKAEIRNELGDKKPKGNSDLN